MITFMVSLKNNNKMNTQACTVNISNNRILSIFGTLPQPPHVSLITSPSLYYPLPRNNNSAFYISCSLLFFIVLPLTYGSL